MRAVGIVAEYNPFHLGHAWHIRETRRLLGEDVAVVCVMSGNFVQRGDCAVLDKRSRAECALLGGADLVLELPTAWAVSSAESFARASVEILAGTGVVDTLSFGCETADTAVLTETARCLDREDFRERFWARVSAGEFVASARERTAREFLGETADCLKSPNNNLAVEYLRFALRQGTSLTPLAIPRRGAGHDRLEPEGGFASGEGLRTLLRSGEWEEAEGFLPAGTAEVLRRERERGRASASLAYCERAILARLRTMTPEKLGGYPDSGAEEGLPQRLLRAAREGCSLEEVLSLAKTKRYAHARLRRLVVRAFLGGAAPEREREVPYLRVLGMNGVGQALLREIREKGKKPLLVRPTHVRRLSQEAGEIFELESRAADCFALCTPQAGPCGEEWRTGPVILEEEGRGER